MAIAGAEAIAGAAIALEVGMPLHPARLDEALDLAGVEGRGEAALPVDVQVEAGRRHRLEGAERAHVLRLLVVQQLGAYPGQRRLHRAACAALVGVQEEAAQFDVEPRPGRHVLAGDLDREVLRFEDEAVAPAAAGQHARAQPVGAVRHALAGQQLAPSPCPASSLARMAWLMRAWLE